MSGLLILLGTDLGLSDLASEASSHTGVNTSLLSPRSLSHSKRAVKYFDCYRKGEAHNEYSA